MKRLVWATATAALLGAALVYLRLRPESMTSPPTAADLQALRDERAALVDRLSDLTARDGGLDFLHAPKGDLLIGLSTPASTSLISQLITGLLGEVRLRLKHVKAHYSEEVKTKFLFDMRTLGVFDLDVDIEEINAVLKPGTPELRFGNNRIGVKLPVTVPGGTAHGSVRFRWEGKGVAGTVCGDADVTRVVTSGLVPLTHTLDGEFLLAAEDGDVVAQPRFGAVTLRLTLAPTDDTWKLVDEALAGVLDEKSAVCSTAIQKQDIPGKVRAAVAKGFDVTLPAKLFRPVRLPAGIRQSVDIQGTTVRLRATPTGLTVTPAALWYGADVGVRDESTPRTSSTPR